jgi:hypothetical protein
MQTVELVARVPVLVRLVAVAAAALAHLATLAQVEYQVLAATAYHQAQLEPQSRMAAEAVRARIKLRQVDLDVMAEQMAQTTIPFRRLRSPTEAAVAADQAF